MNYQRVTETRDLKNAWEKVVMISIKKGRKVHQEGVEKKAAVALAGLNAPFDKVQIKKNERLLGRQVDIDVSKKTSVKHRTKLARGVFSRLKRPFFMNKKYSTRTKLLIWNAVIRSIATYGLNVVKLTEAEEEILDNMTEKHMSIIFGLHETCYHAKNKWHEKKKRNLVNNKPESTEKNAQWQKRKEEQDAKDDVRRRKVSEKVVLKMIEHLQTTTSSWVTYLRHAHMAVSYARGEIDATHPDYQVTLEEKKCTWRDMQNLICGKMEYDENVCRHPLLNANETKSDAPKFRKAILRARMAGSVTVVEPKTNSNMYEGPKKQLDYALKWHIKNGIK